MMLRPAALILALAASNFAWGEALDPPERIAHLSYVEGQVVFQGAHAPPTSTLPDRPMMPGDRLVTEPRGRAELAFGIATIRLDERSELFVVDLDATNIRVELIAGTASVYLREWLEDETFEIVTPNAAIALREPGEYRVDVRADDASVLTVHAGAAEVATAGGPVRVAAGQRVRLEGRDALARLTAPPPADAFDEWILERELRLAEAEPPRYTPYEGDDYEELDRYGEWYDEPRYGRVWMPSYGYAGWAPYHHGYWQRVGFGWSWIDPAPWGFFTFHSGRWAFLHQLNRWCWVPGHRVHPRHFARERVRQEDAPRTAYTRSNAGGVRQPVVMASSDSLRNDIERRPTLRREVASGERARSVTLARSVNREPRSTPRVAEAPRGSGATMRPSRADPPARSEATSDRPQSRPAFGAHRTP